MAANGDLLKCHDSLCTTLSKEQAISYFQPLTYPCKASHFYSYYNGVVTALLLGENKNRRCRVHEAAKKETFFWIL